MNLSKLKLIFSLATLASCMFFFIACEKEEGPAPVPSISSFSPASGAVGETVTITGKNFSEKAPDNTVKFNGTSASVIEATTTKLTVTVPEGATTGKLSVSVRGELATSANDFTVLQAPVVSSFSPETGKAGDEVTINGENFSEKAEENTVKFGSITATVKTATATKLTVIVPEEAATDKITVTVDGRSAASENSFTVINSPKILGFAPPSGMVEDTIYITGENFSDELTENTVKIGEVTAQVIEASTTHLRVKVPEGAMTESIYVTVNGQTASTGEATFKVIYKPVIHSFSPKSGFIGASVTITGEHFSSVLEENVVKIGTSSSQTLAEVTAATPTQLTVTVQEGTTTGYVNVAVNGLSATGLEEFFEVVVPPVITSFSPLSAFEGDEVTITGENFGTTANENVVKFNGVTATVNSASATSLTVTVPKGATTGKITVATNGQTATSADDFTVEVPVNFALSAIATASSTYGTYSPDNVNDGDGNVSAGAEYSWTNDFYSDEGKLPQWVELDFGENKVFTKIVLHTSSGYVMQDYQIQYWDGANWVTIETVVGNTEIINTYTFDAIESAKVRVYATKGSTNQAWFARVNELEVWDK